VLCGGAGTRLDTSTEKPLVTVCGEPMVDRVVRALRASRVSTVSAVPSPRTPRTRTRALDLGLDVVDAPGDGYVADLQHALDAVGTPVVTVVADLPHLSATHVDRALSTARGADGLTSLTVCVPVSVKEGMGVSVDTHFEHDGVPVAPAGLNVVGSGSTESVSIVDDERLAVNVNRPADLAVAESLCD
jgi:adenosylcobinamide-phosphate guanylyltransferase